MPLSVIYHPLSQHCRTVLAFILLNNIPYEEKGLEEFQIDPIEFELKYSKIDPQDAVCAVQDDGLYLREPEAIIRYLINTRETKEKYYPKDPKQRALIDSYLPFHHSQAGLLSARYCKASQKMTFGKLPYKIEEVEPELRAAYEKFEKCYLKENKYIAGGEDITIADLFAVSDFGQVYLTTNFDFEEFPKLKEYIETVLENPTVEKLNAQVRQFGESMKNMKF